MSSKIEEIYKEYKELSVAAQKEDKPEEEETEEAETKEAANLVNNPLFYYVRDHHQALMKEGHDITSISEAEQFYYRITIKGMPAYHLYRDQGYVCVQRALEIDEKCPPGTSSLNIETHISAYYKEIHQDKQGNKTEIILPFNRFGQFLEHLTPKLPIIGSHYCQDLMHNALDGKNTLGKLLEKKALAYFEMSQALHDLWLGLSTEYYHGDAESYIKRVTKYQEKMRALRPYSELALPYHETTFQARVDFLSERKEKDEQSRLASEQDNRDKRRIILEHILALEALFDRLNASTGSNSLDVRIRAYQCGDILIHHLRELTFLTSFQEVEDRQCLDEMLKRVHAKIKKSEKFYTLLSVCFQTGDLDAFQRLLPFLGCRVLTIDLLSTWMTSLVKDSEIARVLNGRIAICQWLYSVSDDYRNFMHLNHMTIKFTQGRTSPLGVALIIGNVDAFSMLLQQGYTLDNEGILYENQFVSILQCALILENRKKFMELLLTHQVNIDSSIKAPAMANAHKTLNIPPSVQLAIAKMAKCTKLYSSDLLIAQQWGRNDIIPLIQERTDAVHLAITLSYLVLNTEHVSFSQNACPEKFGIICVSDIDSVQSVEDARKKQFNSQMANKYLSITLHRHPKPNPALDQIFDFIKALSASLHAKCSENRLQGINASIKSLADKANILKNVDPWEALYYYFACILLMNEKTELEAAEMHLVIQYYCKMADLMYALQEKIKSQFCFLMAIKFVKYSAYENHLRQTKEYKRAEFMSKPTQVPLRFTKSNAKTRDDLKDNQALAAFLENNTETQQEIGDVILRLLKAGMVSVDVVEGSSTSLRKTPKR